ncbi:DUF6482 family protein [Pleionea litopenaei]|uniref:DUF6482 family protein n=1 Tax=Pleionea litopenaei TaxID=3070815 RepID=A0AA51X6G7_9GAMM|nr:DUF6482 family protein [Pleionea sp. HL-JVS1]WMS86801.1 DUF6482 family protein [Pleionea sp. HL-JVS1]
MELNIHALEGGLYLVEVTDELKNISDEIRTTIAKKASFTESHFWHFRSLGAIRDAFTSLSPQRVWLIHNLAYDQMIGLPSHPEPHRQPLHWYS